MKTRFIGILAVLALVCMIAGLTGCKQKKEPAPEPNTTTPDPTKTVVEPTKTQVEPVTPTTTTPPEPAAGGVLVTVNGVDITQEQLDALIKPHLDAMAKQLPPAVFEQQKKMFYARALNEMVNMQLLNEKVEAAGFTVSEDEIAEEMKNSAAMQKLTLEQFKQRVQQAGYDMEQIKKQMRTILGHRKLMLKEFPDEAKYTEEDAKTYYDQNKARYETPEQIRASHILISSRPTDPNSDPNEVKAAAGTKAQELLKQIKEGADFAELAKANSQDPGSASQGGDLNFFSRGRMVPAFEKAAFDLKEIGDVSEVVETNYGFHIIKLTGKKEPSTTSFEEAKDQIMAQQSQMKLRRLAIEYVDKLKVDAEIVPAPGVSLDPPTPPRRPGGAVAPSPDGAVAPK